MQHSRLLDLVSLLVAAALVLGAWGCAGAAEDTADAEVVADEESCEPETTSECRCKEHVYGSRLCLPDETWTKCHCPFTGVWDTGEEVDPLYPRPQFVPSVSGTCPGFVEGEECVRDDISLICTFRAQDQPPRKTRIWLGDGAWDKDSPLVFFWHPMTGDAKDATEPWYGVSMDFINAVVEEGGIFVAFEIDPNRPLLSDPHWNWDNFQDNLPWFRALGYGPDHDFVVMDEIVACAQEKVGIDYRRIHVTGFHAGGLQCGQTGHARSGYVASVACFSGGQLGNPKMQDPGNKYAAFLGYYGPDDWFMVWFETTQTDFKARLDEAGHFAVICDIDVDRSILANQEDSSGNANLAYLAAWQFLKDHPFGVDPEPYAEGLPDTFPDSCSH